MNENQLSSDSAVNKTMPESVSNPDHLEFNERFTTAYDRLENSTDNLFITGKAGTGKSTLLQYFRKNTLKNIVVLAPTGVAAVNVQGQTIHSFFRFKPDVTPDTVTSIRIPKAKRKIYQEVDVVLIDEVSMLRADLLDCINVFLCKYGKNPAASFGGVQMVFFGDLYQLPPVVSRFEKNLFSQYYQSPYFFSAKSYEDLGAKTLELKKVYRQKDQDFIKLLNAVRNCMLDECSLKEFNQRCNPDYVPLRDEVCVYLTTTNAKADEMNQMCLSQIHLEGDVFEGEVDGQFPLRSLPTHQSLLLKEGAQIMMLNNDPMGRWVNGTLGRIVSFRGDELRQAIKVELSGGRIVNVLPFTWEMYQFFFNEDSGRIESEVVGSFTQYPLRLAWALTIHKAQGKTFTKAIIDFGRGTFEHGQAYVALSRCTTLEGLILKRFLRPRDIILDKVVVDFMKTQVNE